MNIQHSTATSKKEQQILIERNRAYALYRKAERIWNGAPYVAKESILSELGFSKNHKVLAFSFVPKYIRDSVINAFEQRGQI
jgi:hypothetical protein